MSLLRGIFRLLALVPVLLLGTVLILLTGWIPIRVRNVRLSAWPATWMARYFMWVFNIRFTGIHLDRLFTHHGFVFPNHESYLDIIVLMNILPLRFLSNHKVRSWPFIGWIAIALDTVFVNRKNRKSRAQARNDIADALRKISYPPLVLFPEGAIGVGDILLPFHLGAFKVAVQERFAFLPCILHYDRMNVIPWFDGEHIFEAVWRLASRKGPISASLTALERVQPEPTDNPQELMHTTREAIDQGFKALHESV